MHFEYRRIVGAPIPTVWATLTDLTAMEPHLPGTAKVVSTGSNSYRVSMKISVGFLRPTVNADAQLSGVELHQSFTINLSGKSMGAGVEGSAEVTLSTLPADEGTTRVSMAGTVETSGLLKKIPDSKVESAVSSFLDSYFASVEKAASSL